MDSLDYSPSFGTFCVLLRSAVREEIAGHTYIHTYVCLPSNFNRIDICMLLRKCGRSCPGHVKLERLTEKEIAKYLSAGGAHTNQDYLDNRQQYILTKHSLRDVPRPCAEMFDTYKKERQRFLNRRSRQSSSEMTDFSAFSGDDFSEASEEEYHSRNSRAHKRKRLAYEDDLEWSPNSDGKFIPSEKRAASRPRKIGLRVNTRRKRIESNSSSSSDDDSFYYRAEYQAKDKSDTEKSLTHNGHISVSKAVAPVSFSKNKESVASNAKKEVSNSPRDSSPLIDNDLLSKIIHEMSDYSMKNSKPANESNENEGTDKSSVDNSNAEVSHYPPVKKRRSHAFKITDEGVTPRLTSVQQILRKMVNHVCTHERRRLLSASGGSRRKICKWCDGRISLIASSNNDVDNDLCTKCRSVSKDSKISNKSPNKSKALIGGTSTKPKVGSKIKSKLYKNLPKYDQQRLAYRVQADKSSVSKGYNHCKSFVTPKDLDLTGVAEKPLVIKSPEKVKLKKKKDSLRKESKDSVDPTLNSKVNKKKKKKILSESEKNINHLKSKVKNSVSSTMNKTVGEKKPKQVSVTNVDKGLFLMTFPEPHQELEIPPNEINAVSESEKNVENPASDSTTQNQSDLSLNIPKQSVTNNVQYGNYLLPPVPTVVVANYAATDAKSGDYYLSSVYYQNEMTRSKNTPLKTDVMTVTTAGGLPSMPSLDQLSTVSPSPTFSFPPCHLNALPVTDFSLPPNINTSNSVLLQPHMITPTNISIPSYSLQANANVFDNVSEIAPASYQASIESDISSLLNNSELQIQSLQPKDSDSAFNLFENQELNLADSFEDSSNMTENCSEDLGLIIKNSVNENLSTASFDNDSCNSEMPAKHSDGNDSLDTDTSKVPEQNTDLNQNSSVAGNSFEESFFHQSETQNLSSEALLEYCSAELDALCILGVVDLDKNPKWTLKRRIDSNKSEVEKLKNAETQDRISQVKLKYLELNGRTLQIASMLLNRFGSFTRLSDSILRKQRLLQIKKEKGLELEETRSSCQFARSAPPPPIVSQNEPMKAIENTSPAVRMKMENAQSCSFASRSAESINHIEKIQTQIQSIQGNPSVSVDPGQLGLVHHFPAPDMPVASNVTLSVTPRTEMMSEFRETPSRGSGPRTPARPESAMSQNDEGIFTPQQIKKERLEASSSPLSQCAFSQNTTPSPRIPTSTPNMSQIAAFSQNTTPSPRIPTSTPNMSQIAAFSQNTTPSPRIPTSTPNMSQIATVNSLALVSASSQLVTALANHRHHAVAPAASVNSGNSQMQKVMQHAVSPAASMNSNNLQIQKVMQMHHGQIGPPNVTVPFPAGNQNFAKVVVNKLPPPPPPSVMGNLNPHPSNANVIVRGNYMNVQPGATGGQIFQRFVQSSVPSINNNMNSYTYKQTMNSGGTMLVNSIGQNYALANSQVLNQQVPRVYNTGNIQQTVQVPNSVNQAPPNAAYLMPNNKVSNDSLILM
ncbi:hypothetical protein AVEN_202910-1 [Araneus ventricosus]|uniref:Uncharacterized protein n=1 Tax=Araneus ventricosus TaxID=182803 RepID=A0A4Y2R864_ARAVE|nr:hypothetical protein AVEN_202910-1 [Araneus ventricosus]